ncbi:hypothetical protein [Haladaptatus litoreus]|uniref:hypothetical protein n=1 Tax=Haladaptatus litoreus TaxID=553468 RepID=UPI0011158DB6|nr:hypothetical protein [Haladaptatus litoreus]
MPTPNEALASLALHPPRPAPPVSPLLPASAGLHSRLTVVRRSRLRRSPARRRSRLVSFMRTRWRNHSAG